MKQNYFLLFALWGALCFFACDKDDNTLPAPPSELPDCANGYRVKERRELTGYVRTFEYDGLGRLYRSTEAGGGIANTIKYFDYSFDTRPDKVRIYEMQSGTEVLVREQTISYSSSRTPVTLVDRHQTTNATIVHRYTTDTQGRITQDSIFNDTQLSAVIALEWSGENIITERSIFPGNFTNRYNFDTATNPYYASRYCFLDQIGSGVATLLSANNVRTLDSDNNGVQQSFDFNPQYYSNGVIKETLSGYFIYECK